MEKSGIPPVSNAPYAPPPSYEQSQSYAQSSSNVGGFMFKSSDTAGYEEPSRPFQRLPQSVPQAVIVNYVNAPNFGPRSVNMVCPQCQSNITTATTSEPGAMAWILAGILCVVGFWPCACIPCCFESLNSVTHKCPQCNIFLGRYKGGL